MDNDLYKKQLRDFYTKSLDDSYKNFTKFQKIGYWLLLTFILLATMFFIIRFLIYGSER